MKVTVAVILLLLAVPALTQFRQNFAGVDNKILSVKGDKLQELTVKLTAGYNTELEKVRSIFRWITENIEYHIRPVYNGKQYAAFANKLENDFDIADTILLPPGERIAVSALRKGSAVCNGYAWLFYSLCKYAGISATVITGYGRVNYGSRDKRFRSNHVWNAVCIDERWYLLDATWASGFINTATDEYVKHFDDFYFLTPPELFAQDHFPDDLSWSLLQSMPAINELKRNPFRSKSFFKYPIISYYPTSGIIETSVGDTIRIVVERDFEKVRNTAPDSIWENTGYNQDKRLVYLKPVSDSSSKYVSYVYAVQSRDAEWLHLMYNDDAILRYRLQMKKEK